MCCQLSTVFSLHGFAPVDVGLQPRETTGHHHFFIDTVGIHLMAPYNPDEPVEVERPKSEKVRPQTMCECTGGRQDI